VINFKSFYFVITLIVSKYFQKSCMGKISIIWEKIVLPVFIDHSFLMFKRKMAIV